MPIPLVYSPVYSYPFPNQHRFPMQKFRLLFEYLQSKGIATGKNVFRPGMIKPEHLALSHCNDYIQRFKNDELDKKELRRMGLPWSAGLVQRTQVSPNGTLMAASIAIRHGIACHLAGGTHHAHYDFGSGFCIFNDLVIAAKTILAKGTAKRILIFDCDVHQGDGSAAMCQDDPNIYTCSIHCEKNFPYRKIQSDLDIGLEKEISDTAYLYILEGTLHKALKESQADLVLYDAGVDIFKGDPLGLINISTEGIRERDYLVLSTLKKMNIPVATVIGGGYDSNEFELAKRHALVVEIADSLY